MRPPRADRGFTLVELLVVVTILAVVGAVVGMAAAGGLRHGHSVNEAMRDTADRILLNHKLTEDIREAARTGSELPDGVCSLAGAYPLLWLAARPVWPTAATPAPSLEPAPDVLYVVLPGAGRQTASAPPTPAPAGCPAPSPAPTLAPSPVATSARPGKLLRSTCAPDGTCSDFEVMAQWPAPALPVVLCDGRPWPACGTSWNLDVLGAGAGTLTIPAAVAARLPAPPAQTGARYQLLVGDGEDAEIVTVTGATEPDPVTSAVGLTVERTVPDRQHTGARVLFVPRTIAVCVPRDASGCGASWDGGSCGQAPSPAAGRCSAVSVVRRMS